jgi:hypothetical protein
LKKYSYKSTGSFLLLVMGVLTFWFTWGLELLSVIGGCLVLIFCLSASILLWSEASDIQKGEKDG